MNHYDLGRDYIDSMRAVAELTALNDEELIDYFTENIAHVAERLRLEGFTQAAFDGLHDALLGQFNELVVDTRRRRPIQRN